MCFGTLELRSIEYNKKKKSKNKIQFIKDPMFKVAEFKKDKIKIADGLAPGSSTFDGVIATLHHCPRSYCRFSSSCVLQEDWLQVDRKSVV